MRAPFALLLILYSFQDARACETQTLCTGRTEETPMIRLVKQWSLSCTCNGKTTSVDVDCPEGKSPYCECQDAGRPPIARCN
jgi:hypothetical protein